MSTALKILAAIIVVGGGFFLFVEFEVARIGAISPLDYLAHILIVAAIAIGSWIAARRIDRRNARAKEIAETF